MDTEEAHPLPLDCSGTAPSYSIVIPAWNESDHIEATIESVLEAQESLMATGQKFHGSIIVVDNNSTDDTAAKAKDKGATVVHESVNQIARARNTGAAAATADYLIFLDADTAIKPRLLQVTLEALAGGKTVAGGSTLIFDRPIEGFAKHVVSFWNWWSRRRKVAAGCYLFCTQEAFNAVGGFDERQFAAEELVLSRKLRKYAKAHNQEFKVFDGAPVVSSARKLDWYTKQQKLTQLLLLIIPGSTRSKKRLAMWYDRSHIDNKR